MDLKFSSKSKDAVAVRLKSISSTRNWNALAAFCSQEQNLSVLSFKLLVNMYKCMKKQQQVPKAVACVENMIFKHKVIPQHIKTAKDAREWNKNLRRFMQFFGKAEADTNCFTNGGNALKKNIRINIVFLTWRSNLRF